MYAFVSAPGRRCQAREVRAPAQQARVPLLRVKLHYHGVALEGERGREGAVTERARCCRHALNGRRPAPTALQ